MTKVTLIGAGNMGGALAKGWLRAGQISLTVADKNPQSLRSLSQAFPDTNLLSVTDDNIKAVQGAEIIVLAVKPWLMQPVIDEIKQAVDTTRQVVVSDAANFTTDRLAEAFGRAGQYAYAIPNIAAEYADSMNFIAAGKDFTEQSKSLVSQLYDSVGNTLWVEEKQVAAGMMMASCGIAYVFRMIRAMMQAGVEMGFYPAQAQTIAEQTMLGAISVLRNSGLHPEAAIDKVTTPGGTTIKGINEMDMSGFTSAVIRTLKAGLK